MKGKPVFSFFIFLDVCQSQVSRSFVIIIELKQQDED